MVTAENASLAQYRRSLSTKFNVSCVLLATLLTISRADVKAVKPARIRMHMAQQTVAPAFTVKLANIVVSLPQSRLNHAQSVLGEDTLQKVASAALMTAQNVPRGSFLPTKE